jgi:hypothetical protein
MSVANHAATDAEHHGAVSANQCCERIAVVRCNELAQELAVAGFRIAGTSDPSQMGQEALRRRIRRHEGLPWERTSLSLVIAPNRGRRSIKKQSPTGFGRTEEKE